MKSTIVCNDCGADVGDPGMEDDTCPKCGSSNIYTN
jgi:predicted RNA-binding Zn-ribbon protein involved in translation (DUF1610 family)